MNGKKMNMSVINIKRTTYLPNEYIYIGRKNKTYNLYQSKWANPFIISDQLDRNKVLELYEDYIRNTSDLWESLDELDGKTLACWCHPKPCHGHILIKLLNEKKLSQLFN